MQDLHPWPRSPRGGTKQHQGNLIPSLVQIRPVLQLLRLTLVSSWADSTKPRISAKPVFTWFHPHLRLFFDLIPTWSLSRKGLWVGCTWHILDRPILIRSRGQGSFSELFPRAMISLLIYTQMSVALKCVNHGRLGRTSK